MILHHHVRSIGVHVSVIEVATKGELELFEPELLSTNSVSNSSFILLLLFARHNGDGSRHCLNEKEKGESICSMISHKPQIMKHQGYTLLPLFQ